MNEVQPRVRMEHVRKAMMCSKGSRTWFKRHGLDWQEFLKNGIEPEKFEATGDPMAIRVAEIARGRR